MSRFKFSSDEQFARRKNLEIVVGKIPGLDIIIISEYKVIKDEVLFGDIILEVNYFDNEVSSFSYSLPLYDIYELIKVEDIVENFDLFILKIRKHLKMLVLR